MQVLVPIANGSESLETVAIVNVLRTAVSSLKRTGGNEFTSENDAQKAIDWLTVVLEFPEQAGDDMADLAPGLDLALLPVSGWGLTLGRGHLGPSEAAAALPMLKPRIAIPIHWGTLRPVGMRRLMSRRLREPPHEFARQAAQAAPEVEVRILNPGDSLVVSPSP